MKEVVDYGVLGFLGMLSVIVVALAIERLWFYATVRVDDYNDKRLLDLDLHKRLTLIATIGSNAPYVGLLGTVAGIMITFVEIGANTSVDTWAIMTGLSLALKATAAGLIVAIPSIVAYNLLGRKADVVLTLWDIHHKPYVEPTRTMPNRPLSNPPQPQRPITQQTTQQVSQLQRQAGQVATPQSPQSPQSPQNLGQQGVSSAPTTPRFG